MIIHKTSICFFLIFSYLLYRSHLYIKLHNHGGLPKGCLPLIDTGYPTIMIYLTMLGFKVNWWIPFLVFAVSGIITILIDRIFRPMIPNMLITLGIPVFGFLMFYYLYK